MGNDGLI